MSDQNFHSGDCGTSSLLWYVSRLRFQQTVGAFAVWSLLGVSAMAWQPGVSSGTPTPAKKPVRVRINDDTVRPLEPTPPPSKSGDAANSKRDVTAPQGVPTPAVRPQGTRGESVRGEPTPARRSLNDLKMVEPAGALEPTIRASVVPSPPRVEPIPANTPDVVPQGISRPATKVIDFADVAPGRFRGVVPGETTLAQAQHVFGKPTKEAKGKKNSIVYTFQVAPYPQVEATVADDIVTSLQIQLPKPTPAKEIVAELELTGISPTLLYDAEGMPRAQLYPERAITFRFNANERVRQVTSVILERNSAEHFLTRYENDRQHQYEQNALDLRIAQELAPRDGRPHWYRAKRLAAQGHPREALTAANEALRLDPDSTRYQLTKAMLLAESGQHARALKETRNVLQRTDLSAETQAIGEFQYGALLATGQSRDYKAATERYNIAIAHATSLIADESPEVRRTAKEVLLDAHLAMANDIAWGNWGSKKEVVQRWLTNAEAITRDLVENDDGDPALWLRYYRSVLSVQVAIGGETSEAAREAIELGRNLIAEASDAAFKQQMEWELGETLRNAISAAQAQGQIDEALAYAENAASLIESGESGREASARLDCLIGGLYYTIGSLHSTGKNDHLAAIRWFDKATTRFANALPDAGIVDVAQHGERLVSMGVSYWQTGDQEKGLKLSSQGTQWLQKAVKANTIPEKSLVIPYNNLASMHRQMGNNDEARSFASLAMKLEPPKQQPTPAKNAAVPKKETKRR